VRGGDAVRRAGIVDVLRALDEPDRLHRRVLHGNDLVVLAVKHEGRDIELLQVLGEDDLGEDLLGWGMQVSFVLLASVLRAGIAACLSLLSACVALRPSGTCWV